MIARHYRDHDCSQLSNELKRRIYAFLATAPAGGLYRLNEDQIAERGARTPPHGAHYAPWGGNTGSI